MTTTERVLDLFTAANPVPDDRAIAPPTSGMLRKNPPMACRPTSLAMVAPASGWLRYSRSQYSQ